MTDSPAYGLWGLVLINSFVFILFAYSFQRSWSSGHHRGAEPAFRIAGALCARQWPWIHLYCGPGLIWARPGDDVGATAQGDLHG